MGNTYKDLIAWIQQNRKHFAEGRYSTADIVSLAIACGFDRGAIAQWQTQMMFKKVA